MVAIAGGVVMTAAIVVPIVGFAVAPALEPEEFRWVDVGPLADFPEGETSSIAVSGPAPESDRRVFVRRRDDAIIPIWNRCTHLGCPVSYSSGGDVFACPCHGGAYDSVGRVTAGPPARPLDRFDYKIVTAEGQEVALADASEDDRLLIGRPYSVDDDENPFILKGPGEPVDGVLKNLYPSPRLNQD
jgi:nitrite reductase/ring-hydroxylating ferredoxin subunit